MNAKNIILAILMVLSFVACTSEIDGIDNNTTSNGASDLQTSSLFVHMVDGNQQTKSGSVEDETTINNYVIAVFEEGSKQRVGYMTGKNINKTTESVDLKDCKEGIVNVIVVANVTDVHAFDNLYTYNEFTSVKVGNPDNLTKVGTGKVTLKKDGLNKLEVTLKQLTARVNVTLDPKVTIIRNDETTKEVSATIKLGNYNYSMVESSSILNQTSQAGSNKEVQNVNGDSFTYYTYPISNPKLTIDGDFQITVDKTTTSSVKSITVPFVENGTTITELLAGNSYNLNVTATLTVKDKIYDVNFTYELVQIREIKNEIGYN